jgi:hypothetical protein
LSKMTILIIDAISMQVYIQLNRIMSSS